MTAKDTGFRLAALAAGLLAALLLSEVLMRFVLVRHLGLGRFRLVEGNFEYHNKADIIRPSPALGYEFIPNSAPGINALGLRDRERSVARNDDVFRILFLGDSVTANGNIPAILERSLATAHPGRSFEVWNCAAGGYQVSQYVRFLEDRGFAWQPDLVLVGVCLNDFGASMPVVYKTREGEFYEYYNNTPRLTRYCFQPGLFRVSYLYRFVFFALERGIAACERGGRGNFAFNEGHYWLSRLRDRAARENVPLYFAVYPYLSPLPDYTQGQREEYRTVVTVLERLGLAYTDLVRETGGADLVKLRREENRADILHPGPGGDALFARGILQGLEAAGLIPPDGNERGATSAPRAGR